MAVCTATIFGQSLTNDLKKSFNKFSLVKINNKDAVKKAKGREPFNFSTAERNFQFVLRLNDLRSKDFTAEYTDKTGRHILPKGEAFTYKATLIGQSDSVVALTVTDQNVEGYVAIEDDEYFIEAAKKYSQKAGDDDKVIYKTKDKVNKDDGICGLDEAVAARMENREFDADSSESSGLPQARRIVKVATEADYAFVQSPVGGNGNTQSANDTILSLLNLVDTLYQRQLGLSIIVTFQHAWDTIDPYAVEPTYQYFLYHFTDYWEYNFPRSNFTYNRDMAHLFSGKHFSNVFGAALLIGAVCNSPESSYAFTAATDQPEMWKVTAHEIGHLLSADHSKYNSIMQANFNPFATGFSFESIDQIKYHISRFGFCLDTDTNPAPVFKTPFDFDGDGEADVSVSRPSNATWYIQQSTAGFYAYQFGVSTDKIVPADYDGDGKTDVAVFRSGTWYIQRSAEGFVGMAFGAPDDIPVPGDFTGDGRAELVVFRPSNATWYIFDLTNNQSTAQQFGATGDKPLIMDFDGDHKNDFTLFRDGIWKLKS